MDGLPRDVVLIVYRYIFDSSYESVIYEYHLTVFGDLNLQYRTSMGYKVINFRHISSDDDFRYIGIYRLSNNPLRMIGYLPKRYKFSNGTGVSTSRRLGAKP
jgi:hypothetical protein